MGPGRGPAAADLAHELKSGSPQLGGGGRLGVAEFANAATHTLDFGGQAPGNLPSRGRRKVFLVVGVEPAPSQ